MRSKLDWASHWHVLLGHHLRPMRNLWSEFIYYGYFLCNSCSVSVLIFHSIIHWITTFFTFGNLRLWGAFALFIQHFLLYVTFIFEIISETRWRLEIVFSGMYLNVRYLIIWRSISLLLCFFLNRLLISLYSSSPMITNSILRQVIGQHIS